MNRNLSPLEWNFAEVPDEEVTGCMYYEYARESAFIRSVKERCVENDRAGGKWSETLDKDLIRIQSIHPFDSIFLRGFFFSDDLTARKDRHPEAPPINPSFPKPWLSMTPEERKYRADTRTWIDNLPPIECGHWSDAQIIYELGKKHADAHSDEIRRIRQGNPGVSEIELAQRGSFKTYQPRRPSYFTIGEHLLLTIRWELNTDEQLAQFFRKWVKFNRPSNLPKPDRRGHRIVNKRVALDRLGIMRLLHLFTLAEMPRMCPAAFKKFKAADWYKERRSALLIFKSLFPFLTDEEEPVSWPSRGGGARCASNT